MGRRGRRRKKFKFKFHKNPKVLKTGTGFLLSIIAILVAGYFIYTADTFKIKKENIRSNLVLGESLEGKIIGKSLFSVNIKLISQYLWKKYPEYKVIYVTKRFPSSLVVNGIKRKDIAQVKGKSFYPIDKDSVLLSNGSSSPYNGLIIIELNEHNRFFRKGFKIQDGNLNYAFDLIETLKSEGFLDDYAVRTINPTNLATLYFIVDSEDSNKEGSKSADSIKIIVGESNFKDKIRRLKNIISKELNDKLSLVKYIDLRFKKIYIEFKR